MIKCIILYKRGFALSKQLREVFLKDKSITIINSKVVKVIYIKVERLSVGMLTINKEKLIKAFSSGCEDVKNNMELQKLFGEK